MTSSQIIRTIASSSLALCLAATASGQIDHRINRGNSSTAGRALDRNSAVGSGGFNLTRPGMTDPGAKANAIITGNVTGLAGFKDYSPVLQTNQFRDTLPSATLSGFQSRSVGMPEVSSNHTLAPTYYFGQSETITNAGQIEQGLNATGTSILKNTDTPPPTFQGQNKSTKELNSLIRPVEDRRVGIFPVAPDAGITQRAIVPLTTEQRGSAPDSPYGSAMGSSIFGTPPPTTGEVTRPSGSEPLSRGVNPPWADKELPQELVTSPATADLTGTNPRVRQQGELDSISEKLGDTATAQPPGGVTQKPIGQASAVPGAPPSPVPTPDNLGADRYADLYNAVELAQRFGARNMGFNIGPSANLDAKKATADQAYRTPEGIRELIRKPSEGLNQLAAAAKWAKDVVDDPLRTFAGKNQDRLNQYMTDGEADLRAGRYYTAARKFDLAATVDPMNPLPLLGRGHAFIAAGDYVSAVHSIEEGIRRFPQIAAFRIDLPALVGQHDIFDIRRADLDSKLASTDNVELRFLLGYIELYSGLPEEGLKNLERAAKDAPPASMISIFADLVSGRRELPVVGK